MFTGIVQAVGKIRSLEKRGGDVRLEIDAGVLPLDRINLGDSIAVNGCCLTVIEKHADGVAADASRETLALTTLGDLAVGAPVNLEMALTLGTPLGGHLVLGHVDGVGTVTGRREDARSVRFEIGAPVELSRYIARKGSVCVDGVSLTVNQVNAGRFDVNIIPHTLEHTVLKHWQAGSRVNLEVDLLARYLERLMQSDTQP
ncbi:MAG: riboflavin synthase [Gammaproteobacteria bacterium]|nr:riboflavin synthase [Gammaproteobacteria bacterium]MDE2022649.1 riboflavin synthase [Gammaproteobacteria bacterium]MDE2273227.1 riboflavin synthase [Gammaproteobacteria bacterium]